MDSLLILIIGFIAGTIAGVVFIFFKVHNENKILLQKSEDLLKEMNEKVIPCKLEFHDDVIFMYRRDTGLFLTKGNQLNELEVDLKERFPDNYFDVDQSEIDEARVISLLNERKANASSS